MSVAWEALLIGSGAFTFLPPCAVGVVDGWLLQRGDNTSEVAFGLGFVVGGASSFVAAGLGTLAAHLARRAGSASTR